MSTTTPSRVTRSDGAALAASPTPTAGGGRGLRRVGALAVTVALVVLGLAGGLWLGSPSASAATGDIEVDMDDGHGFVTGTSQRLLDIGDLTPGGSVSGSMTVKDTSGTTAGSGHTDTIRLVMGNVATADGASGGPTNTGAGDALAQALSFDLAVNGNAVGTGLGVNDLQNGVILDTGLVDGDQFPVALTASLPSSVGNDVQYGQVTFTLGLGLETVPGEDSGGENPGENPGANPNPGGDNPGGENPGGENPGNNGSSNPNPGGQNPGSNGSNNGSNIDVLGTNEVAPGEDGENGQGSDHVLVLGQHQQQDGTGGDGGGLLSYTGAPIRIMLAGGGVVLLAGVILLLVSRRRRTRHKTRTGAST